MAGAPSALLQHSKTPFRVTSTTAGEEAAGKSLPTLVLMFARRVAAVCGALLPVLLPVHRHIVWHDEFKPNPHVGILFSDRSCIWARGGTIMTSQTSQIFCQDLGAMSEPKVMRTQAGGIATVRGAATA